MTAAPIRLRNEWLEAEVAPRGAELWSLRSLRTGRQYLWQGDARWWDRRAPVLFPIVGHLPEGRYRFRGKDYRLPTHGFAPDRLFRLSQPDPSSAEARLSWDSETMRAWPFRFDLRICFALEGPGLRQSYELKNCGPDEMCFSIGFHPGFRCPLQEGECFEDYVILFERPETLPRQELRDGLRTGNTIPFLQNSPELPLRKELFAEGAVVLQAPASRFVDLWNPRTGHGVRCGIEGFPWLSLWTRGGGSFLCIEPWNGITGRIGTGDDLCSKEGILRLPPGGTAAGAARITPLLPAVSVV
jgi:galactose mutarotase-like enzyme